MKKKTVIIVVCAVVALAVAAFLLWRHFGTSADDGSGVYVQSAAEVNMYTAPSATVFAGVVESQESVTVDPQSGKKVAQLLVKEGDLRHRVVRRVLGGNIVARRRNIVRA